MEILRWHKRFSVGNKDIDLQHKMLINLTNYLTTGSGEGYKHEEMVEILEELVAYTEYHCAFEEELLENHPLIESHRKMHAGFVEKVLFFEKQFKDGKEDINGELFVYLVKWIRDHILEIDIEFFGSLSKDSL